RGLLFQRFAQLARALLLGLEQPDVLNGDRGLIGEGRKQGDVLLLERPHLGTEDRDGAERATLSDQGHAQDRVGSDFSGVLPPQGKFVASLLQVSDLDWPHVDNRPPCDRGAIQRNLLADRPPNLAETHSNSQNVILDNNDTGKLRLADTGRVFG